MIKKLSVASSKVAIGVLITGVLLEILLRVFPSLIPIYLLVQFDPELRSEIAQGRHLPTVATSVLIDRDDSGPPLRIFQPFTELTVDTKEPGIIKTIVTDEYGFCNPPQNDYGADTIDIIALGDSFTWCTAVKPEDTWASRLQSLTGQSTYNLGSGGIGLYEYIQLLKVFGLKKSPQIVILNAYEGNDLRDAVRYQMYRQGRDAVPSAKPTVCRKLPSVICKMRRSAVVGFVEDHSYAINLPVSTLRHLLDSSLLRSSAAVDRYNFRYGLMFSEHVVPFNQANEDVDEVVHAEQLRAKEIELELFTEALNRFVELSRKCDFIPVVTYTPSAYTAYEAFVVFDDPDVGELLIQFSEEQREFFKRKGLDMGYVFLDLTPSLRAFAQSHGSQDLLYFTKNLHLTPSGHSVIAATISKAIMELDGRSRASQRCSTAK